MPVLDTILREMQEAIDDLTRCIDENEGAALRDPDVRRRLDELRGLRDLSQDAHDRAGRDVDALKERARLQSYGQAAGETMDFILTPFAKVIELIGLPALRSVGGGLTE